MPGVPARGPNRDCSINIDEKKFLLHLCSGGFYNHPCKDKAVLTAEGRWESFRIELCSVGLYI